MTPLPIFLLTSAALPVGCRAIFDFMGDFLRAGLPWFGREVKKLLACLFLHMRISRLGTTLAGVLDTSSPP